jgi:hypothetical protein
LQAILRSRPRADTIHKNDCCGSIRKYGQLVKQQHPASRWLTLVGKRTSTSMSPGPRDSSEERWLEPYCSDTWEKAGPFTSNGKVRQKQVHHKVRSGCDTCSTSGHDVRPTSSNAHLARTQKSQVRRGKAILQKVCCQSYPLCFRSLCLTPILIADAFTPDENVSDTMRQRPGCLAKAATRQRVAIKQIDRPTHTIATTLRVESHPHWHL